MQSIRERAAQRAFASAPTQVTDAIKPIRLVKPVNTDSLPATHQQPVSIVHIASVQAPLVNLTNICQERILQGFRLAYLNQRIALLDALYVIRAVYFDPYHSGKIYARLEREDG